MLVFKKADANKNKNVKVHNDREPRKYHNMLHITHERGCSALVTEKRRENSAIRFHSGNDSVTGVPVCRLPSSVYPPFSTKLGELLCATTVVLELLGQVILGDGGKFWLICIKPREPAGEIIQTDTTLSFRQF